jgi:hypothetical protein
MPTLSMGSTVCRPLQCSRPQNNNVFHTTSHSFPHTLLSRPVTSSAKGLPISEASHRNTTVTTVHHATTSQLLQRIDIPLVLAGGKQLFCTTPSTETYYYSAHHSATYCHDCTFVFMYSTRHSGTVLMKLEFSLRVFERCSNIKFHENLSRGSRVVPCGQRDGWTDGQHEDNNSFLQFCERA